MEATVQPLPRALESAGVRRARLLDVRPVLDKGGDPFTLIMKTARTLGADEALHLVVGFEPRPLYEVMRGFGREAYLEKEGDTFHVWFYAAPAPAAAAAAQAAEERPALQAPVEMDVRGLEPPGPMLAILERLVELGPGAQLRVHHHREPVLLYDKLKLRGYAARTEKRGEGDYLVHIAPAWALGAGS